MLWQAPNLEFDLMADDEPKTKGHTLADHVYGLDLAHTHDGYADHEHDFPDESPLEENPIWIADHVSLMTVGIDIGSSGTQVIFSRVNLRRLGEDLSSRYFVVSRETLFLSAVALTPYRSQEHIDEAKLGATTASVRDTAASVGHAANGVGDAQEELQASLVALREALESVRTLADSLERDPSVLLRGPHGDGVSPTKTR